MSTLSSVELRVLGPVQVRQGGAPVSIPGAKPRAILTMLGLHDGSVVSADTLVELLWGEDPPRTAAKALQTHISSLRRALGDGFVLTEGAGWTLAESEVDAARYKSAARRGRDAAAAGDTGQAVARFEEALTLWRGIPELPDGRRGTSEKTRWIEGHAALVEDRADALLATGRAAEIIGELEAAVADAPLRERRWGQLMLALYRAGRQGEALGAYQRARALLADELGVDPGPELRRLEAAIVAQDTALETPAVQQLPSMTRAVTFLLTDIEGSTAAWEADADAMAAALARHDELVEQVVTSRGGRLIKTRGEGDATFSVFERPSGAAAAAIELQEAIAGEPWALREPMRIRVALHTGEVELRDGDYFGRAVNRAARLRSLAAGGQILCSGATAELVIDSLPDDVLLADLGMRQLRNLARPEHVFELRLETADEQPQAVATDAPIERPSLPAVLAGPGPFVGRGRELERLFAAWQTTLTGGTNAVLIAGEPGVGKTRLAGEWSRQAYDQGALVIYGRCDEDLGAPYQPFAEALRSLVPCLGSGGLRGLRGVEALLPLVPGLTDVLPDLAAPARADPDTERYALFDAVVALLGIASAGAPVILILDDLHWAAKPTLLLLRHLLRFGEHARVQVVGTYRSTDLDRSHPLAAMLADLHRDGTADRLQLGGLDEDDVTAYVAEAGYHDEELARALASVTGGNPFFLIEALRHVAESGGRWDASTLPQGVREAVSRRLSRLAPEANKALSAAAVVGSRFALDLVERVVGDDLVDAFDEACKAGIVIEEPGGRYRFNHAIVRQSLLAELPSVRRMRLHQRIATTLENEPGADDELLAELAHHYFECAWAGNAAKAVEYCRRAADQAMARLAYEGAADLYDRALHALEEIDDELPDREDQVAALLVARCDASLAAGDVASAAGAVSQLQAATVDSARLAAWATCFDGQLSMLIHPERLDEVEAAVGAAASKLAQLNDAAGEAKAHTVRAGCLARLGRIGDCEIALDDALTAARRGREHRAVNEVLAGAPLAALWGPNPVPRAGGRCLDVVRLLRITTDSPAVEATSTRCQAVLEAFRGRGAAARRMIDSARRTVTELGLRHALCEVEQFAGIVELVVDDPAAAEPHLRKAYNGFRRMGLDADTAETAALLGRTCLSLDRDAEAIELCAESERLAGHALKPSIAWRTLRAHLLSRGNDHDGARRVADAAVALAERTDLLVDHGDACASLATVLDAAGDAAGARAAAERAVGLYERKGAAALAEKARGILGAARPTAAAPPEPPTQVEPDTACVRAIRRVEDAIGREAWGDVERELAPEVSVEGRRKVVGFPRVVMSPSEWATEAEHLHETGAVRHRNEILAVRGERLALARSELRTEDKSPGAPQVDVLRLFGLDNEGRIALLVSFDIEDVDAAVAELDATHARFEEQRPRAPLENAATRVDDQAFALFADGRCDEIGALYAADIRLEDRRQGLRRESNDRATAVNNVRAIAALGANITNTPLALRGDRLCLSHVRFEEPDPRPDAFGVETLEITEVDTDGVMIARVVFDVDDVDAAYEELEARYLAGEAAPYTHVWQIGIETLGELNRHEPGRMIAELVYTDHRRVSFAPGDFGRAVEELWALVPDARYRTTAVHALDTHGTAVNFVIEGTDVHGNELQWPRVLLLSVGREETRLEVYEEDDVDAALARFEELRPQARRLENAASQAVERYMAHFAARDWDALTKVLADDIVTDDRRRVVNAGMRHGRDAEIAILRATADAGFTYMTSVVIANRGERLILARVTVGDRGSVEFLTDVLGVIEINSHNQITAIVVFEPDEFDDAIAELDARYIAGEAAAHARTWSVITEGFGALNRRELPPTTPDWVNIDHRRVTSIAPGEMPAFLEAVWELTPDLSNFIEAVHRLNSLGAVISNVAHETSQEGANAEWRVVNVLAIEGALINRCEVFDEADLDAALARFDELSRPALRLENTATRVFARLYSYVAAGDWHAVAQMTAENVSVDDRRRVVNAGTVHGRDAAIAGTQATVDVGFTMTMVGAIATRGEHLALLRVRVSGRDPETIQNDALNIVEIDAEERIVADFVFDLDDFESALAELDARYIAGEAAAHARTWLVITGTHASVSRHELPAMTPDCVTIDHRRANAFAPGELTAYIRAGWDLDQTIRTYVEVVHRLSDLGAVCTYAAHGVSHEGFDAEWREVAVTTVEGDLVNRCELFDEADLDTAIARFEQLSRPAPRRLENAATHVYERLQAYFAARDWGAVTDMLAEDVSNEDRRRVVNAGIRRGRDATMEDFLTATGIGITYMTSVVIAARGELLVLIRTHLGDDERPEAFHVDFLQIVEIDANERITVLAAFDPDDIDAAFAELDARYLAGEAAAHSHTWSVLSGIYAGLNRHELPPTTPDWVNVDRRRVVGIAGGDQIASLRDTWDLARDFAIHIETVHRLTDLGAVCTYAAHGASQQGFDAEWRGVNILTFEGDRINRCEIFDEADLDTALSRFDQLNRPVPRLENTATQITDRIWTYFAARDWAAMAELLAEGISTDDRRRVVNAGVQRGRDIEIATMRTLADVGVTITSTAIATRGERLALRRARLARTDPQPEAFHIEVLGIVEIDADNRVAAGVLFDPDGIDAAFEELDARYLAGEATDHAHTWSAIVGAYAALNRRELAATTPDFESIDHRRPAAMAPGELIAYLRAALDLTPELNIHIEAVHRLSDLGAVVTHTAHGTSREGFDAEWREVSLLTADGDTVSRCELFDEADIDAAIARFEQLSRPAQRLENAATQVNERIWACYDARDWHTMNTIFADDMCHDDRRRMVGAGVLHGRDAQMRDMRAYADIGVNPTIDVIATRGERLALTRARFSGLDPEPQAFVAEGLVIVEIDAEERMATVVAFDPDDFDAALAELDARYLAGEAADHAHTWSAIVGAFAAINRHELPELTPDWVNVDHRRGAAFAAGEMTAYLHDLLDDTPDINVYIEVVHRMSDLGAVVTQAAHGTSQQGFEAEWREIGIFTFDGDLPSRCELFDEADLDAALARFDQLSRPALRLENAASRTVEQFFTHFGARDWDAMAELLDEDVSSDDRRGVVNAGIRRGRDLEMANWRATDDIWTTNVRSTVATRGERLALLRFIFTSKDGGPEAFSAAALAVVEINDRNRVAEIVVIEPDDIDTGIAELDARYLAGEAAAHAHTWSVITRAYAAINRHELPATTPDWVNIDHRRGIAFAPGDATAYLRASQDPQGSIYIETVPRLSDLGAVFTWAGHGTSQEGFEAEWRGINVVTIEGDLINRGEIFDEADVDAAIARFDQLSQPARRLENAASQTYERFRRYFAERDWAAMAELLTADTSVDDHRRVVNAEIRRGRDVEIANMRAFADIGAKRSTATVIATRGEHLVLCRTCISDEDQQPGGFRIEMLIIVETTAEKRLLARVAYDPDDFDAAFAELDARYLAGEAAAHAHTWSAATGVYAALNRHEYPALTQDSVCIDRRPLVPIETVDLATWIRGVWDLTPDLSNYIETVHRLSNFGAVLTHGAHGTSQEGFGAEWRVIAVLMFEGDRIGRLELFDEADVDAALARFDQLSPQAPRLENATTRIGERIRAHFAARDWDAIAELLADDICTDDRRRIVGAGIRHGRDAEIAGLRATAEVGTKNMTTTVLATRGENLALGRVCFSGHDQAPATFLAEVLGIVETNADNMIKTVVVFDLDDIDAAFAELDNRYLAGEAAAHSHTWSLIAGLYAGLNRHELGATTPDFVDVDHRRLTAFAPGDLIEFARTAFDQIPDLSFRIEAVHGLSNLGAVVTQALRGTSREGFEAEWREIHLTMIEGDMFSRSEIFDETDVDAALARFEELHRHTRRLVNAASQVEQRFWTYFATLDWDAMAELLADDISTDDRRPVVNAGVLHGRDVQIANMRALADVEAKVTANVVATRGERLALTRFCSSNRDLQRGEFGVEMLNIVEIDTDNRIAGVVSFDIDDIDAAFAELDARYLAGEAAAHARTWSVIARAYAALNRHEFPATTADWIAIDHRPLERIEAHDLAASIRAMWDLTPNINFYIQAVHRLSDLGGVITQVAYGTSREGFDAEWRHIAVLTVDGDVFSRGEVFDEADLDAALARFDQLDRPAPRLENAATRVYERLQAYFAAREWDAMAEILADDHCSDDRRRVVNAGIRRGRDIQIANMQTAVGLGTTNITSTVIATRGERLTLRRVRFSGRDQGPEAFHTETLGIVEIDADERIAALVSFDLDDMDAAFEELDARYLAGEAAAHSRTWSAIAGVYAAFNRRELPAPDYVTIDHRRATLFTSSDLAASIRDSLDLTPDLSIHIEAVHRLNNFGAVLTNTSYGTSQQGFDAEWRMIQLLTVEGDRINLLELFDETDLDAALARLEELQPQAPRLENAAGRIVERYQACFSAQDWAALAELLADDIVADDRRRVVNAGVRRGRDVYTADMQAAVEVGAETISLSVIATRGERLALAHARAFNRGSPPGEVGAEWLGIAEIDADERIVAIVVFDLDDVDAAFAELDARYLAGEAAAYAHTWSVNSRLCAGFNRHELPATTPDWIYIDHRPLVTIEANDLPATMRASWDLTPDISIYMEAVHRLSDLGAVVTAAVYGSSQEGFAAEWRMIDLFTVEGDLISRCEIFDEADLDAALARFEELQPQARRLENAATQVAERLRANFAARDWTARAELLADDCNVDDRRRVVNAGNQHGRDADIANMRAIAALGVVHIALTTIATRGERLALSRARMSGRDQRPEAFYTETLTILEIDTNNRAAAQVVFDPDDIDAALAELDARYLAGEAAAHSRTWSVIVRIYAAFNGHELYPTTADWVNADHRRGIAFAPGDMTAYLRAGKDLTPDTPIYIETVHRLSDLGVVVTQVMKGTSRDGFDAEWQEIGILTVEGDLISRCELFDEADLDAALARFDELSPPTPVLENAATQTWVRLINALNRRDVDSFLARTNVDGQLDDRRKGLRALLDGPARRKAAHSLFRAPESWRMEVEPVAIRGYRLGLTRERWRDTDEADRPITVETMTLTEITDDELVYHTVVFDPDDINGAIGELTDRWIASGEVAHPEVIKAACRLTEAINRHDWDAFATLSAGATYVNHRQLSRPGVETIANHMSSFRAMASLVPDFWIEQAEVLTHSAIGIVNHVVLRGTSTDGVAIEIPLLALILLDGDRVTRFETFDSNKRDLALARFEELNLSR